MYVYNRLIKKISPNIKTVLYEQNCESLIYSLDQYFDQCDVMVVPLFIGSGQRVKIIEAFSRGYTVIQLPY